MRLAHVGEGNKQEPLARTFESTRICRTAGAEHMEFMRKHIRKQLKQEGFSNRNARHDLGRHKSIVPGEMENQILAGLTERVQ